MRLPSLATLSGLAAGAVFCIAALACAAVHSGTQPSAPPATPTELLTVAETSDFRATARYDQVVALMDALAKSSPNARRASMGKTVEGRDIPLLIIADPPVSTPEQAAQQAAKGKLVALIIGNIHAGEVDGKEALPILAREILADKDHPLLTDYILILAPIYNADGNERVSKDNRPGQVGPEEGMGIRENAKSLDLNRDFIKLEAPETRALVRAFATWDPHIFIDTHTTNGSHHRYTITYAGPKTPAGDAKLIDFVRDRMIPEVSKSLDEHFGYKSFFYGNFNGPPDTRTAWETFPAEARYGTSYFGLRNRIGILSEGYSYASYKDRVLATKAFVQECLTWAAAHKDEVRKVLSDADAAAIKSGREAGASPADDPSSRIALRSKAVAAPEKVSVAGFEEVTRDGKPVATDRPRDYQLELFDRFEPTLSVTRPYAYIIPRDLTAVIELLQRHGIEVDEFREDIELDTEVYSILSVARALRRFQGHTTITAEAETRADSRRIDAGEFLVRTGQKLGNLAAYILEPQSEDGIVTWNFLDERMTVGHDYPILRIPRAAPITTTAVQPLVEFRKPPKRISFEDVYDNDKGSDPNLTGSPIGPVTWLDDGEHFYQNKDGKLRKVNAATGRSEIAFDSDQMAKALAELPTIGAKSSKDVAARCAGNLTKDRTAGFAIHENDLYYARSDGSSACRLTSTPQREELATFSPDGAFVAFVRDNNLFAVDVKTQTERALTSDGAEHILNGKADWVYFEEVFNRNWRTYWWSPDSARIAFFRTDNSRVPEFTIVDDLPAAQNVEHTRFPRPGEPNPTVQFFTVTVAGGSPTRADLATYAPDASIITGVGWWPDSSSAWCWMQDRAQTWLDFTTIDPRSGATKKLFRDTTGAWVDQPLGPEFLKDGSFLISSERDGFKHLYHYAKDGTLKKQLTTGDWEVRRIDVIDEPNNWAYFSATADNPVGENLYRTHLDGSDFERLTKEPGSHRADVDPKGTMFIDSWSSWNTTQRTVLRRIGNSGGDVPADSVVRTLDSNPVYSHPDWIISPSDRLQIPTRDGFPMEAAIIKPASFDPSSAHKYPVWISTYAGPAAPTISDSFGSGQGRVWDQVMADAGFIILRIDPRSASGKGAKYSWTAYKQLGIQELADLTDAIDWLKTQPWADAARVGISGHSYGGFMTSFALTHSELFAAGIAGAPVTDWRDYDTIYTERFMLTPQDNPDGYDKGSVTKAAAKLRGRLLLIHGTMDDNVHLANSMRLIRAFQSANKPFDFMLYPPSRHGIGGKHYQRLMFDFMRRELKPERTPDPTPPPDPSAESEPKPPQGG